MCTAAMGIAGISCSIIEDLDCIKTDGETSRCLFFYLFRNFDQRLRTQLIFIIGGYI